MRFGAAALRGRGGDGHAGVAVPDGVIVLKVAGQTAERTHIRRRRLDAAGGGAAGEGRVIIDVPGQAAGIPDLFRGLKHELHVGGAVCYRGVVQIPGQAADSIDILRRQLDPAGDGAALEGDAVAFAYETADGIQVAGLVLHFKADIPQMQAVDDHGLGPLDQRGAEAGDGVPAAENIHAR